LWKGVAKGKESLLNYILKTTTIKGEREWDRDHSFQNSFQLWLVCN
jgi:hypothetical protein